MSYAVGRGKPPKNTQWGAGQSGNPKGRPRREKKKSDGHLPLKEALAQELCALVPVKNSKTGKMTQMPAAVLLARSLIHGSLKAPPKEQIHLLQVFEKLNVFAHHQDAIQELDCEEEYFETEEDRRILQMARDIIRDNPDDEKLARGPQAKTYDDVLRDDLTVWHTDDDDDGDGDGDEGCGEGDSENNTEGDS